MCVRVYSPWAAAQKAGLAAVGLVVMYRTCKILYGVCKYICKFFIVTKLM